MPSLSYVGIDAGEPPLEVKSDDVRAVKVYVTIPGEEAARLPAVGQYRLYRPRYR